MNIPLKPQDSESTLPCYMLLITPMTPYRTTYTAWGGGEGGRFTQHGWAARRKSARLAQRIQRNFTNYGFAQ